MKKISPTMLAFALCAFAALLAMACCQNTGTTDFFNKADKPSKKKSY